MLPESVRLENLGLTRLTDIRSVGEVPAGQVVNILFDVNTPGGGWLTAIASTTRPA
jgi:hypothetical protein